MLRYWSNRSLGSLASNSGSTWKVIGCLVTKMNDQRLFQRSRNILLAFLSYLAEATQPILFPAYRPLPPKRIPHPCLCYPSFSLSLSVLSCFIKIELNITDLKCSFYPRYSTKHNKEVVKFRKFILVYITALKNIVSIRSHILKICKHIFLSNFTSRPFRKILQTDQPTTRHDGHRLYFQ